MRWLDIIQLTHCLTYPQYQVVINDPIDSLVADARESCVRAVGVRRSVAQKMTLLDLAYTLQKGLVGVAGVVTYYLVH